MLNNTSITWPLVIVLGFILAGASFLGYSHVLTGDFVGSIYGAVIGGSVVGHFSTSGTANG